ncbi:hypothetical protein HG531_001906 [Fusarium graminearum]|nr:hypothetical protein HG531_001906 [Fusarium graminearum]
MTANKKGKVTKTGMAGLTSCELVSLQVSWRCLVALDLVDNGRDGETSSVSNLLECRPDQGKIVGGNPSLGDESSSSAVIGEVVKCIIHSLLLGDKNHPGRERLRDLVELCLKSGLGVLENVLDILQTVVDLVNLVTSEVAVLINVVNVGAHGLGDLADLVENLLAVSEDDEDVLVDGLVVEDALKRSNSVSSNDSSNKADVHAGEGAISVGATLVVLDVGQQGSIVVVSRCANLLNIAVSAVKETAGLTKNPSPLGQVALALLQSLVTLVKGGNTLLQFLTALGKLVDFGSRWGCKPFDVEVQLPERDTDLVHLRVKLSLNIIETSNLLSEGTLEGANILVELYGRIDGLVDVDDAKRLMDGFAYIAELAEAKLSERSNNFATDFIGNIELDHTHVRRAERSVGSPPSTLKVLLRLGCSFVRTLLEFDNLQRCRSGGEKSASAANDGVQVGDINVSEAVGNPLLGLIQELVNIAEIETSADSKLLKMLDQRGEQRKLGRIHSASLETQRSDSVRQTRKNSINVGLAKQEVAAGISSKAQNSNGLSDSRMSGDELDNYLRSELTALGQVQALMERNTSKCQRVGPLRLKKAVERVLKERRGASGEVDGLEPGHIEKELLDHLGSEILVDVLLGQELLQVWG